MPETKFLFMEPSTGPGDGKRKTVSTEKRAFVMRNARANQAWSTRSNKSLDRRKAADRKQLSDPAVPGSIAGDAASVSAEIPGSAESSTAIRRFGGSSHYWEQVLLGKDHPDHPDLAGADPETARQPGNRRICRYCGSSIGQKNRRDACSKCGSPSARIRNSKDKPLGLLLDGIVDPFDAFPVVADKNTSTLLTYFVTALFPQINPLTEAKTIEKLTTHWMTHSLAHSAHMHSILCMTALQLTLAQPPAMARHNAYLTLHHRTRAIMAIRDNLLNPDEATSDENIAAVFNLLFVEESLFLPCFSGLPAPQLRPDNTQRLAHMDGLKKMLNMRGGLVSIGSARALQSILIRYAVVKSSNSFSESANLPAHISDVLDKYPACSPHFDTLKPMAEACRKVSFHPVLCNIIARIECLLLDTEAWLLEPGLNGWDSWDLQNLYSLSIDAISRWYSKHSAKVSGAERALALGVIAFIAILCRGRKITYGAMPGVIFQLRDLLAKEGVMQKLEEARQDVWVAMIAVIASEGHEMDGYFFRLLLDVLMEKAPVIRSYDELLHGHLSNSAWPSLPMGLYGREIWDAAVDIWASGISPNKWRLRGRDSKVLKAVGPCGQAPVLKSESDSDAEP